MIVAGNVHIPAEETVFMATFHTKQFIQKECNRVTKSKTETERGETDLYRQRG